MKIIHTCRPKTGSITVSKVITGLPEDEAFFHIIVTGQSEEPTIVDGYVSQLETITFDNLPFDTYVITEDAVEGYTLSGIVSDTVVLSRSNRNESVVVTNELDNEPALELTWNDIGYVPVADPTSVSDWNTFFDLPTYGSEFTSVEVVGNLVQLRGGSGITLRDNLFADPVGDLKIIDDKANCVIAGGISVFTDIDFELLRLPALVSIGAGLIFNHFESIRMDSLLILPDNFIQAYNLSLTGSIELYFPSLTNMGSTTGHDVVFPGTNNLSIVLTIPTALMICNGGSPDGDINTLITDLGNTVTIFDPDNNQIYP